MVIVIQKVNHLSVHSPCNRLAQRVNNKKNEKKTRTQEKK